MAVNPDDLKINAKSLRWQIVGVLIAAVSLVFMIVAPDRLVAWFQDLLYGGRQLSVTTEASYRLRSPTALRRLAMDHDDLPVALLKAGDRVVVLDAQDTGKFARVRSVEDDDKVGFVPRAELERVR